MPWMRRRLWTGRPGAPHMSVYRGFPLFLWSRLCNLTRLEFYSLFFTSFIRGACVYHPRRSCVTICICAARRWVVTTPQLATEAQVLTVQRVSASAVVMSSSLDTRVPIYLLRLRAGDVLQSVVVCSCRYPHLMPLLKHVRILVFSTI